MKYFHKFDFYLFPFAVCFALSVAAFITQKWLAFVLFAIASGLIYRSFINRFGE